MEANDRSHELCLSCGLCCNGTLFNAIKISDEDGIYGLKNLGFVFQESGETLLLPLPCIHFQGRSCSVYSKKIPTSCTAFQCRLLIRFKNGEHDWNKARNTITTAKKLILEIQTSLDKSNLKSDDICFDEQTISILKRADNPEFRQQNGALLLKIVYLQKFLATNFVQLKRHLAKTA